MFRFRLSVWDEGIVQVGWRLIMRECAAPSALKRVFFGGMSQGGARGLACPGLMSSTPLASKSAF
jgi:hypothetical protein